MEELHHWIDGKRYARHTWADSPDVMNPATGEVHGLRAARKPPERGARPAARAAARRPAGPPPNPSSAGALGDDEIRRADQSRT